MKIFIFFKIQTKKQHWTAHNAIESVDFLFKTSKCVLITNALVKSSSADAYCTKKIFSQTNVFRFSLEKKRKCTQLSGGLNICTLNPLKMKIWYKNIQPVIAQQNSTYDLKMHTTRIPLKAKVKINNSSKLQSSKHH